VKVNIMRFRTLLSIDFKASAEETGIYNGVKIVFLESTFHRLSADALLVYQKTVHEDTKQVIPGA
jgi:hypothetical protein